MAQNMDFINEIEIFIEECWKSIFREVHEAVVYIDSAAAECLHWHTGDQGYVTLKSAGAISVHNLAAYNLRDVQIKDVEKAVLISTSAEASFYEFIVNSIMRQNMFQRLTIITTVHYSKISYDNSISDEKMKRYRKMQEDLESFMSSKSSQNISLDIIYVPIFISLLTKNLFTTPPFANLMPPLSKPDSNKIKKTEIHIDHFVSSLESLFQHLNIIEDIYTIGKCSEYIAETLKNLPAAIKRRSKLNGVSGSKLSLILIDRTFDLCAATSHDTKSLLSRMLSILPHLPNHTNDIAVNMTPIVCECKTGDVPFDETPGCLATTDKSLIDTLVSKKEQTVLLTANQLLQTMLISKESPKSKIATRVSIHSLEKLMYKFRDNNEIYSSSQCSKQLQIIWAVVQSLKSDKNTQIELLLSIEKLLSQNLAVSRDSSSVVIQLSNIIKTRNDRKLDTENLLALLIYVYALAGTQIHFPPAQEQLLEEALSLAIYEDMKIVNEGADNTNGVYQQTLFLLGFIGDEFAKDMSMEIARQFMTTLHTISKKREGLRNYISLVSDPHTSEMVQYVGILEQLVKDIINPSRPKIHDLHLASMHTGIGFNLFSKSKIEHHPADNPWILIYVVGGITPEESKKVQEILSTYKANYSITLAGSRLLNPLDIVNKMLLSTIMK